MNISFVYSGDKAVVTDDEGNIRKVEYRDNLEDILSQENLVEELEDKISKLEERKNKDIEFIDSNKPNFLKTFLGSLAVCSGILFLPFILFIGDWPVIYEFTGSLIGSASFITVFYELIFRRNYKERKKIINGITRQIGYLNEELEKQREKLQSLKKEISNVNENTELKSQEVNNNFKEGSLISNKVNLLGNIGYNEEKYRKLYEYGGLREELNKFGYTQEQMEFIEEYIREQNLEEKSPVKAKRKTRKYGD